MLGGCAALLPDGMVTEVEEPSKAPAGPVGYEAQPTVALNGVVAGVVGTGVLVENHSPEHLSNVEIVINPTDPSGGFRFRTENVPPNATKTYICLLYTSDAADDSALV